MTVNTVEPTTIEHLECVELTIEDPGIPCESEDCSNTATLVVHLCCSCIALSCRSCYEELVFFIAKHPGIPMACPKHHYTAPVHRLNDFVKSVAPL